MSGLSRQLWKPEAGVMPAGWVVGGSPATPSPSQSLTQQGTGSPSSGTIRSGRKAAGPHRAEAPGSSGGHHLASWAVLPPCGAESPENRHGAGSFCVSTWLG